MSGAATATPSPLEIEVSRHFTTWLAETRVGLAFTTYQTGKLFLLGLQPDGRLAVFERTFNRAMGLAVQGRELYLSTLYQLWRFDDALAAGQLHQGHDRLFVPQLAWTTGDLDIHDVGLLEDGRPVFVNTLFSCLATPDVATSFRPYWQPPFITRLAAEDRCHLNGLAMRGGLPAYVSAVAGSNTADGWRDERSGGGIVIDVASGEPVIGGLAMPHSPRLHDAGDGEQLWLLDSGTGRFGRVDRAAGRLEPLGFCPGYARGLACHGRHAVIGLSRPRGNRTFEGLPLEAALTRHGEEARSGLLIVDLLSGETLHWLRFGGIVEELYDVAILEQTRRPMALGLKTDEIRRTISIGPSAMPPSPR